MPMMALIPVASVTVIGMMGVFARQNRKEGWVKTRKTLIDALRQARRDLLTIPEAAATSSAVAYAGLPPILLSIFSACSVRPRRRSHRGLSGIPNDVIMKMTAGMATAVNIQRQPTCTFHDANSISGETCSGTGCAIRQFTIWASRIPTTTAN